MLSFYAAPVRRDGRNLSVNPLGGDCVLAKSPHDAHAQLGMPGPGSMFAVWVFGNAVTPDRLTLSYAEAGRISCLFPPSRIYAYLGHGLLLPLDIDPALDVTVVVGGGDAGSN